MVYRGGTMSLKKRLVATIAAGGLLLGAFAGPAAAHKVTLDQMYMSEPTFGQGGVNAQMWLSIPNHAGKVMLTLKKKNSSGDWVNAFDPKQATYQEGWGYTYTFKPVSGDKTCKVKGVFTKANHDTVKGVSETGPC